MKDISLKTRLYTLALLPVIALVIVVGFIANSTKEHTIHVIDTSLREHIQEIKVEELVHYVELGENLARSGIEVGGTESEMIDVLSNLNYGTEGYFFGYKMDGTQVFSGTSSANIGKDFSGLQDPSGKYIIRDLINQAKNNPSQPYYYEYAKQGYDTPVPKVSMAFYIPELDMIVGTGVYLDAVDTVTLETEKPIIEAFNEDIFNGSMVIAVIIVLAGAITFFINRTIMATVIQFNNSLAEFAKGNGDLTSRITGIKLPEFNEIGEHFNTFVSNLHGMISTVSGAATKIDAETDTVTERSNEISGLLSSQNDETNQVATAMTEMSATATDISANAKNAEQSASLARESVDNADTTVREASNSVHELVAKVNTASEHVIALEHDVHSIGEISEVISKIADQTNLLALNAAIEAARAGDAGRGFAVVADEVRQLASRTQESTSEIEQMLERLTNGTRSTVNAIAESTESSADAIKNADNATESLGVIKDAVRNISDMNTLIATATEQQNIVSDEISERVVSISTQSAMTGDLSNTNKSTVDELKESATQLNEVVSKFTL